MSPEVGDTERRMELLPSKPPHFKRGQPKYRESRKQRTELHLKTNHRGKTERRKPRNRVLTTDNTLTVTRGEVGAGWGSR